MLASRCSDRRRRWDVEPGLLPSSSCRCHRCRPTSSGGCRRGGEQRRSSRTRRHLNNFWSLLSPLLAFCILLRRHGESVLSALLLPGQEKLLLLFLPHARAHSGTFTALFCHRAVGRNHGSCTRDARCVVLCWTERGPDAQRSRASGCVHTAMRRALLVEKPLHMNSCIISYTFLIQKYLVPRPAFTVRQCRCHTYIPPLCLRVE